MTCDAHFRTRMRYSSQKPCVKIWFGLVEIRGMLIFRGGGLLVTCDAHFRTCLSYSSQKSCENLVLIGRAFQVIVSAEKKKKKKKKLREGGGGDQKSLLGWGDI